MKLYRIILDPAKQLLIVFLIQFIIWYLLMPDKSVIQGVAPKFYSSVATQRFFLLFVVLLFFIKSGSLLTKCIIYNKPNGSLTSNRISQMCFVARLAFLLFFVAELIYIRHIIINLAIIIDFFSRGYVAGIGEFVRAQSITGITSLVNLYLVPTAIYSALFFHDETPKKIRSIARKSLIIIGIIILFNALLLASRMQFVYYLFCFFGAYILIKKPSSIKFTRNVIICVIVFILLLWVGETLRYGLNYATKSGYPLFSMEVQKFVLQILTQAYFASDLNNAYILLNWKPTGQYFESAIFFRTILESFGYTYSSYNNPDWESTFGTVNVLGLWWKEIGWYAIGICTLLGFYLGSIYQWAQSQVSQLSWSVIFFIISFPGVISLSRINYFGLPIFQIPFLYLVLILFIYIILPKKRERYDPNRKGVSE